MLFTKQSFDAFALETLEERMEKLFRDPAGFPNHRRGSDPII